MYFRTYLVPIFSHRWYCYPFTQCCSLLLLSTSLATALVKAASSYGYKLCAPLHSLLQKKSEKSSGNKNWIVSYSCAHREVVRIPTVACKAPTWLWLAPATPPPTLPLFPSAPKHWSTTHHTSYLLFLL